MRVLVVGPESSGGRWVADLLRAGAPSEVEVAHYSMPHGPDGREREAPHDFAAAAAERVWRMRPSTLLPLDWGRHWPTEHDFDDFDPDRVLITTRDWLPMTASAGATHPITDGTRPGEEATLRIFRWLDGATHPFRLVSFEALVEHPPRVLASIYDWLEAGPAVARPAAAGDDLAPIGLDVVNGKWYARAREAGALRALTATDRARL